MSKEDYRVPVPPNVKKILNDMGKTIGGAMPPGYGFALLIFTVGDAGFMTYISNCEREDILMAMQEFMREQGS